MSNPRTGQPLRGEELWRWANMQEIQGHYDDRGPTDGGRPLAGYHHCYGHWDNGPGYGGDNVERSYAGHHRGVSSIFQTFTYLVAIYSSLQVRFARIE